VGGCLKCTNTVLWCVCGVCVTHAPALPWGGMSFMELSGREEVRPPTNESRRCLPANVQPLPSPCISRLLFSVKRCK